MTIRVNRAQVKAARRVARLSIAGLSVLAVVSGLVACGGNAAPQPTATVTVTSSPPASPATPATAQPTSSGTAALSLKVYFMRPIGGTQPDKGPFIASAHRDLPATKAPATAALKALLGGPTARERAVAMATAIPAGTTLRGLTIVDGTATVDLSGAFASGGGTLSLTGRLAQVVYTLTQFPSVTKGVVFKVDGKIVTVFGGEGIMLTHPQKRSDYEAVTPPIFVDSPAAFAVVTGSALKASGTADVFEATFRARLVDATGSKLAEKMVMATSGSGTRGAFGFTLPAPSGAGAGRLIVWDNSMKDGSALHRVTIPVTFAP